MEGEGYPPPPVFFVKADSKGLRRAIGVNAHSKALSFVFVAVACGAEAWLTRKSLPVGEHRDDELIWKDVS